MMATTELDKIPETILSRSQVYEFRMISTKAIADQLRTIVDAEQIEVDDESLQLIARDADGSMRDAQSKLDQVIAFTGKTITSDDVGTVLGLVGRDMLFGTLQAVADEDAVAAFVLAGRAVEMGYDLRLVCRELARVVRDLLVLSVDPSRASDPEIAGEGERDRLLELAKRFLARRSAALLRPADARGERHPRRGAAALPPRDGAAAVDPPAQARRDRGSDRVCGVGSGSPRVAPKTTAAQRSAPPRPHRARAPAGAVERPRRVRRLRAAVCSATRVVPPAPARPSLSSPWARAESQPRRSSACTSAASDARPAADESTPIPASGGLGGSALRDAVLNGGAQVERDPVQHGAHPGADGSRCLAIA